MAVECVIVGTVTESRSTPARGEHPAANAVTVLSSAQTSVVTVLGVKQPAKVGEKVTIAAKVVATYKNGTLNQFVFAE